MKPRRHFKETDVKILRKTIARDSAKLSNLSLKTPDNIDQYFEILTDIINKSIAVSTPLQKLQQDRNLDLTWSAKQCKCGAVSYASVLISWDQIVHGNTID